MLCTVGFCRLITSSFKELMLLKSRPTDTIRPTKQTTPKNHKLKNDQRISRFDFLMRANLLIIKVMIPITGTAMKNISVPHANRFCQPSVSTKFFSGNNPIATVAIPNNAKMTTRATHPKMKYIKILRSVIIMLPSAPEVLVAA